jgi:signal transduction histidine kinase
VRAGIDGDLAALPPTVGLAAYRILQEALTNAVKHAGPASAQVRLGFGPSALSVEVFDTGRGPAADADQRGGHGLVGMRERVALYGGELSTGPRPGGGFRVYARIPMDTLAGLSRLPDAGGHHPVADAQPQGRA